MSNARELAELGGAYSTGGYPHFKNRIINGAMMIDQRNAGASVTIPSSATTYTVDRWQCYATQASKFAVQRNAGSVTPPAGFINYAGITSSSAYSVTSGDFFVFGQIIEGFNAADLGWGAAGAQSITVSFQVRSSLTGTFGGVITNGAQNRSYPFTFTVSSANTWETKTVTIAGDTSGTWATGNTSSISLYFSMGTGSTYSGTAGAWAGSNYYSATGSTSVVGTSGATFYITGVQLEKGSTATAYDYRPYGTELALCQRYYWQTSTTLAGFQALGANVNATQAEFIFSNPVQMRAAPTVAVNNVNTFATYSWATLASKTATSYWLSFSKTSGFVIALAWSGSDGSNAQSRPLDVSTADPLRVSAEL